MIAARLPVQAIHKDARNSLLISDQDAEKAPQFKADVEAFAKIPSSLASVDDRYPAPTPEERMSLRKVADSVPLIAYTLCIVEFAERASYYGASQVFNNFLEFDLPKG